MIFNITIPIVIKRLSLLILFLILTGCGFHLRDAYLLPDNFNKVSLTSYDSYATSMIELRKQFQKYKITEVPVATDVTNIHILGESYSEHAVSVYQNRITAEKEIKYVLRYQVTLPNQQPRRLSAGVTRTLLDDPVVALAKSAEQEQLIDEMRQASVQQVMRQLAYFKRSDLIKTDDQREETQRAIENAIKENNSNLKSTTLTSGIQ